MPENARSKELTVQVYKNATKFLVHKTGFIAQRPRYFVFQFLELENSENWFYFFYFYALILAKYYRFEYWSEKVFGEITAGAPRSEACNCVKVAIRP